MKRVFTTLLVIGIAAAALGKGKDFTISFGDGGFKTYKVIDNSCYVYIFKYPKNEKNISNLINKALMTTLLRARKQFSKENDGFINIKTHLKFLDKDRIIYQICGDVVRRR